MIGNERENSILILAPTSHDAKMACDVLEEARISAKPCSEMAQLCYEAARGCGALIVAEEALTSTAVDLLESMLHHQEPWSDLPVIILTGPSAIRASEQYGQIGNVSFLERPFSRATLVSSAMTALRARRKQYEVRTLLTQLHEAKERADRANSAKGQFLANMSHEIRTPLGAILGFVALLRESEISKEDALKYVSIIDRNSRHLMRILDDVLDLSKVEAGKISIERDEFSLVELLADFASIKEMKAQESGVEFRFKAETKLPEYLISDPTRLRQILTNVVGNAIKFTKEGYVELTAKFDPVKSQLSFLVKDTGRGIAKEQQQGLFQAFTQADPSTTRQFGGTGLGLVLTKRISQLMGGDFTLVESELGKGSTFAVTIEVGVPARAKFVDLHLSEIDIGIARNNQKIPDLEGMKVLLVEDAPDNQVLIQRILGKTGASITLAENGEEGVEKALEDNYDVVLMDIQMPKLDGHGAVKKLRKQGYKRPIVALTAHAMNEERERTAQSGFSDFLTKPIDRSVLFDLLSNLHH